MLGKEKKRKEKRASVVGPIILIWAGLISSNYDIM
jgi:hypothetical protein